MTLRGRNGGPRPEVDCERAIYLKKKHGWTWRRVAEQLTKELGRRVPLQGMSVSGAVTRWRRERRP